NHAPDSFSILSLVRGLGLTDRGSGRLQGSHPVHGSETENNFVVDSMENVWHCFRHGTGGGPYQLLGVLEGVIDCSDSVPGALKGELFKHVRDLALEKGYVRKTPVVLDTNTGDD